MTLPRALVGIALLLVLAFPVAGPVRADGAEEEIEELEERIEILIDEARILNRAGHKDAAEVLEKRVHVLRRELADLRAEAEAEVVEAEEQAEEVLEYVLEKLEELAGAEDDREAVDVLRRALREIAEEVEEAGEEGREARAEHPEIAMAKERLATMRIAFKALLEAQKHDAAHLMEYAIHALELGIEGRRDEEARRIRKSAPKLDQQVELLKLAGELWKSWGREKEAAQVWALAKELAEILERKQYRPLRIQLGSEDAHFVLKAMKLAMPALKEAEKPELARTMHKAARALEVQLEGRTDEEAKRMVAHAPKRENVIELLFYAADLYGKWGNADRVEVCRKAGKILLVEHRKAGEARERARGEMPEGHAQAIQRFEQLQRQTAELLEMAQRMQRELERLKREMQQER